MNIKRTSTNLIYAFILCCFSLTAANAATALSPKQIKGGLVPSFVFSDPQIQGILSPQCSCQSLLNIGAIVMSGGIRAQIYNGGTLKAKIKLKLTWYDLIAGTTKTLIKNASINGKQTKIVIITPLTILAKKSNGIKVEIIPVSPADKDLTNNKMTVTICAVSVVI